MSAAIQGIYIALFGRPADPGGLAYWTEVTKGGADLSEMLRVLPATAEYQDRFAGKTPDEVITAVYQNLFGRTPDPEGLAFFQEQLSSGAQTLATIAVNIMQGAQGDDKSDVEAKVEAAQLFTDSLDTPEEIEAYKGTAAADLAKKFLDTVDKDNKPTADAVEKAAEAVVAGEDPSGAPAPNPGGGGGGTPLPQLGSLSDGVLSIDAGVSATVSTQGDGLVITASGFSPLSIVAAEGVNSIVIGSGATLNISAVLANALTHDFEGNVSGAGTLNITGVTIAEAVVDGAPVETTPGLYEIYGLTEANFLVNGNEADTIKAIWDILDERYTDSGNYYNQDINADFVELGLRYVAYLEAGGSPFTDFSAKTNTPGRDQSMHDNLLGNLNRATVVGRNFDDAVEEDFLSRIDDLGIGTRPVFSGEVSQVGGANHDGVRAFDYAKGWAREDWTDTVRSGTIDPIARDGNEMFVGDGNTVTGFNIVRHEGAGIEIALKAKQRGGADYEAVIDDEGVAVYHVPDGAQVGNAARAVWSFDFSVAAGLNGSDSSLDSYTFKAFLDIDPSKESEYIIFDMKNAADGEPFGNGFNPWVLENELDGFNDDDGSGQYISQNSVNYGFNFIRSKIDSDPNEEGIQLYDYTDGEFSIIFQALDADGNIVVENSILVVVGVEAPADIY